MILYSSGGKYLAVPAHTKKRKRLIKHNKPASAGPNCTPDATDIFQTELAIERIRRRAAYKKAREKRRMWITACLIFCSVMLLGLAFLAVRSFVANRQFSQLAEIVHQAETKPSAVQPLQPTDPTIEVPPATDPDIANQEMPSEGETGYKQIQEKYAALYERNQDLFGWLRIDETVIDYPVMMNYEDNEKYLRKDFDGKYSTAGVPFADNRCSLESDNILIYGHNMKDGSMFRRLLKYEKKSFWKKHPTIMFSDLYADYEYEIVSVFYDRIYSKSDKVFKFYQFVDAENESEFNYAVSQFKKKSLYDTGVDVEYGDKLITLITCSYHVKNGRFVVVARRK